jgi:cyanate permease
LEMDGILGFRGWQWVFMLEALPAILLAFVVWRHLTERPAAGDPSADAGAPAHSGSVSPEPPKSFGVSFIFGTPSFILITVSR